MNRRIRSSSRREGVQRGDSTLEDVRCVCVAAIVMIVGVAMWRFNRPPVVLAELANVKEGMTRNEVATRDRTDQNEWVYTWWGSWSIVRVWFDEAGRVRGVAYDR